MAEPATSTIEIPLPGGKKVNIPRWGLIAGAGGLAAAFLLLRNKGSSAVADATAAGDQAATDAAGGADLLSYIQDLFANLQGMGAPGADIVVPTPGSQTQPTHSTTPAPTQDFSAPAMQITPSSYVAAFQAPQYVAANIGAGGTGPSMPSVVGPSAAQQAAQYQQAGVSAGGKVTTPTPVSPPPVFQPIVQPAGHGTQQ